MKPISDFFPRMLPYLPGCSEPLAAQAILDAAIVFCEDAQVVREELDGFVTVAGEKSYELYAPAQQQIARVLDVLVDGRSIPGIAAEDVDLLVGAEGSPVSFYTSRNGSELLLNLFPTPDKAYQVQVRAALRPARNATQLEDDLFNLWSDAVLAGAMARVMAVPGQPFSDPAAAVGYGMAAARAANKARVEGNFGRVRANMRVRSHPFA